MQGALRAQGWFVETPLFRREAIEAQRSQQLGAVRLATPISHRIWALAALGAGACIVAWLFLGHYTRRERVSGMLVPEAGLLSVTAQSSGTIVHLATAEGASVHTGELLLTISDEHRSAALGATAAAVSLQLIDQQARLQSDLVDVQTLAQSKEGDLRTQCDTLRRQLTQIDAQLAIEHRQADSLAALVRRLKRLGTKGYVSALDIQQQQSQELDAEQQIKALVRQRNEAQQQLDSLGVQLTEMPLVTRTKTNDLKRQLAQLKQALVQNEAERAIVLSAPANGTVTSLLVKQGQTVAPGQPLLTMIPAGSPLQARLLVPSSAIGFVHAGTHVALHYQAFPYQKFGVQHGIVQNVSRSALTPSEITQLLGQQPPPQALYRVQVTLPSQFVRAYGKRGYLKPGMVLDADLLLDERRVIEWIFEPLYGMDKRSASTE